MKNIRKVLITIILAISLFFVGSYTFSAANTTDTTSSLEHTKELEQYKAVDSNAGEISCTDIFGSKGNSGSVMHIIAEVYKMMRIAGVLIVIVVSMMDFTGAVASSDADKFKSVTNKFVRRLIVLVAFFLVPTFIGLIFDLAFGSGMSCSL